MEREREEIAQLAGCKWFYGCLCACVDDLANDRVGDNCSTSSDRRRQTTDDGTGGTGCDV